MNNNICDEAYRAHIYARTLRVHLEPGLKNGMTFSELMKVCGFESTNQLEAALRTMRAGDNPVLLYRDKYFIPCNKDEYAKYLSEESNRTHDKAIKLR